MPLHPEQQDYFTEFLAPYFAASTSLPLPCKLDGQLPKGQWTPVDASSETSSSRTNCLCPEIFRIQNRSRLLYRSLHTGSFLTAPGLIPPTHPQREPPCCTLPGETGPSGRVCPEEIRESHASSLRSPSCPEEHSH